MLYLLCRLGAVRLAVPVCSIVEVLPVVPAAPAPEAAPGHLGAIEHRGAAVWLLDLGHLLGGPPTAARLSTRILVVEPPCPDGPHRVALLVAGATDTRRLAESEFRPVARPLQAASEAPSLVRPEVCLAADGAIYRLDLAGLAASPRAAGSQAEGEGHTDLSVDAGGATGESARSGAGDAGWRHAAA